MGLKAGRQKLKRGSTSQPAEVSDLTRALLAILSLMLVVAPVIYGLQLYGMSFHAYLSPRLEGALEALQPQGVNIGFQGLELVEADMGRGVLKAKLTLSIRNPTPFALRVEDFHFNILCASQGHGQPLGEAMLEEVVEVPPRESRALTLILSLTPEGVGHVASYHTSYSVEGGGVRMTIDFPAKFSDAYVKVSVKGVAMELKGELGAMPIHFEKALKVVMRP
jgi:hypothetical protein